MMNNSELIAQIEVVLAKATPGEWEWWTSNSFLRLSSKATGKDGGVIDSYVMRDGHPTLRVTEADKCYIAAVNPAVMTQVVVYVRELEQRISEPVHLS